MDDHLVFDRQTDGRAKTGRAAIGTVSRRTERLVTTYLAGTERLPDAVAGAHDFADVRDLAFPGDTRRLMDMRRSGVVEAISGGSDVVGLSAKLANSIGRSNALHRTYAPLEIEAVARLRLPLRGTEA